jgi:hypothetical protein
MDFCKAIRLGGLFNLEHITFCETFAEVMYQNGVAVELNFHGHLPPPPVEFYKLCIEKGIKIAFGSDAHNLYEVGEFYPHLKFLQGDYGYKEDLNKILVNFADLCNSAKSIGRLVVVKIFRMNAIFIQAEKVASRTISGEAVLVNTEDGHINVLNKVAADIWEFLQAPHSIEEIVEMVSTNFECQNPEQIRNDVIGFLKELESFGLISAKKSAAPPE